MNLKLYICAAGFALGAALPSYADGGVAQSTVAAQGIDGASLALARKNSVHEAILRMAAQEKIKQSDLPAFYARQAKASSDWFTLYFKTSREAAADPAAAIAVWDGKTKTSAADADAWFFLAVAQERSGNIRAAAGSYGHALSADRYGRWGMAYYLRGLLLKELNDPEAAAADLEAAITVAPGNPYFYHARASLGVERANYPAAAGDMRKFFELATDTAAIQSVAGSIECEELAGMGFSIKGCATADNKKITVDRNPGEEKFAPWEYESQGEKNELVLKFYDAFSDARNIAAENAPAAERARAVLRTGDTALVSLADSKMALKAALKLYDLSIYISPSAKAYVKRAAVYASLARLYRHTQALQFSADDIARAVALDPAGSKGWAYLLAARLRYGANDMPAAISALEKAVSADPQNACFLRGQAELFSSAKQYKEAAAAFERLRQLSAEPAEEDSGVCEMLAQNGFAQGNCHSKKTAEPASGPQSPLPSCSPPLELITDPQ